MNPLKQIKIAKLTLNIGAGEPGEKLEKMKTLMERISNSTVVTTKSYKRIPTWGIRPNLQVGVKTTLRGKQAEELLKNFIAAKNNTLSKKNFDIKGNLNFGIQEYISIPGVRYDPKIGMQGLNVCVTLERAGYSIKKRKICPSKIGNRHIIKKEEAIEFISKKFKVDIQ